MRKLLNTLYVNEDDSYLHLKGKNVAVSRNYEDVGMVPLINLEDIVTFGRSGASPALISECLRNNIGLTFMNPEGQFLGRITAPWMEIWFCASNSIEMLMMRILPCSSLKILLQASCLINGG